MKIWYAPNKFEAYGKEEINLVVECLNKGWLAGFGDTQLNLKKQYRKFLVKNMVYLLILDHQLVYYQLHV